MRVALCKWLRGKRKDLESISKSEELYGNCLQMYANIEAADEVLIDQKCLTGNCRKVAESLVNLSPGVMCKVENMPNKLVIKLRRLQARMLKMSPVFFLLLMIKRKRKEGL